MSSMLTQALMARAAAAHKRLGALQARDESGKLSSPDAMKTALRELNDLLEELRMATEQLQAASDDLALARREAGLQAERYHELHENLPLPCILTDDAGCVNEANTLAARMLNVTRLRLPGKPLLLFVPAREQYFQLLEKVRSSGVAADRLLVRPRDKRPRQVGINITTLPNQLKWCWVFTVSDDQFTDFDASMRSRLAS
jgi:PAS domain-containing protein